MTDKVAYRPHQLAIDIAKPGVPAIISLLIQRLEMSDGEIVSVSGYQGRVYKKATDVATERVEITDPVTGLSGEISVAGLDQVLKQLSNRWVAEELICELDPDTGWPINCEKA